jgi:hypothetical protein
MRLSCDSTHVDEAIPMISRAIFAKPHFYLLPVLLAVISAPSVGTAPADAARKEPAMTTKDESVVPGFNDTQAMIRDTQRTEMKDQQFTLIWWIPEQFWQLSLASNASLSKEQREDFLKRLRPFTMVMVVNAKVDTLGAFKYESEAATRKKLTLVDTDGNAHKPLPDEDINDETRALIQTMAPVLAGMLGSMGQNMRFYLFNAENEKGKPIADPESKGSMTVKLGEKQYKFRLPLGSVLPPRKCAGCNEMCSGDWKFCPWCGKKLPEQPAKPKRSKSPGPGEL